MGLFGRLFGGKNKKKEKKKNEGEGAAAPPEYARSKILPSVLNGLEFGSDGVEFAIRGFEETGSDVFKFNIAGIPFPIVVFRGNVATHEFYAAHYSHITRSDPPPSLKTFFGGETTSICPYLDGMAHAARKKIYMEVFTPQSLDCLLPRIDAIIQEHLRRWTDAQYGGDFALYPLAKEMVVDIIFKVAVGLSDSYVAEHHDHLRKLLNDLVGGVTGLPLPIDIPQTAHGKAIHARDELYKIYRAEIAVCQDLLRGGQPVKDAMLHLYVQAAHQAGEDIPMDIFVREIGQLCFSSTQQLSTYVFVAKMVASHPEVAKRVAAETAGLATAGASAPTAAQLAGLEYTQAFSLEVLRFYPILAFLHGNTTRDWELAGFAIPKGALLLGSTYATNHDPAVFINHSAFDPERFLPARNDVGRAAHPASALVPQGGGTDVFDPTSRKCAGEPYIHASMKLFAIRLVHGYTFDLKTDQNLNLDYSMFNPTFKSRLLIENFAPRLDMDKEEKKEKQSEDKGKGGDDHDVDGDDNNTKKNDTVGRVALPHYRSDHHHGLLVAAAIKHAVELRRDEIAFFNAGFAETGQDVYQVALAGRLGGGHCDGGRDHDHDHSHRAVVVVRGAPALAKVFGGPTRRISPPWTDIFGTTYARGDGGGREELWKAVFSPDHVGRLLPWLIEIIDDHLAEFARQGSFDLLAATNHMAAEIVFKLVVGAGGDFVDSHRDFLVDTVRDAAEAMSLFDGLFSPPVNLPGFRHHRLRSSLKALQKIYKNAVAQISAGQAAALGVAADAGEDDARRQQDSLAAALLAVTRAHPDLAIRAGVVLADRQTILAAVHDMVATLLAQLTTALPPVLAVAARVPGVGSTIHAEVARVFADADTGQIPRSPEAAEKFLSPAMPTTAAFAREIVRCFPVAPLLTCVAVTPFTVPLGDAAEAEVPVGATVVAVLSSDSDGGRAFDLPAAVRRGRHGDGDEDGDGEKGKERGDGGYGDLSQRPCIGQPLVLAVLRVFVAKIAFEARYVLEDTPAALCLYDPSKFVLHKGAAPTAPEVEVRGYIPLFSARAKALGLGPVGPDSLNRGGDDARHHHHWHHDGSDCSDDSDSSDGDSSDDDEDSKKKKKKNGKMERLPQLVSEAAQKRRRKILERKRETFQYGEALPESLATIDSKFYDEDVGGKLTAPQPPFAAPETILKMSQKLNFTGSEVGIFALNKIKIPVNRLYSAFEDTVDVVESKMKSFVRNWDSRRAAAEYGGDLRQRLEYLYSHNKYCLYSRLKPAVFHWCWDDAEFARQRLGGINPMMLEICRAVPADLVFAGDDGARVKADLDRLAAEGLLFITDYRETLSAMHHCGKGKYVAKDAVAFYHVCDSDAVPASSSSSNNNNKSKQKILMPHSIQLLPGGRWLTPGGDPTNVWLLAKLHAQVADAHVHQFDFHFGRSHTFSEGIILAMERQLSPHHPLFRLLRPHTRATLLINTVGRVDIFARGGMVDVAFAAGRIGGLEIVSASYRRSRLMAYAEELRARGVDAASLPVSYPFRDDAEILDRCIRQFCHDVVEVYYEDDAAVVADYELAAFSDEIRQMSPLGVDFIGYTHPITRVELADMLANVIFVQTVQHGVLNTAQWDFYSFVPNMPLFLNRPPPTDAEVSAGAVTDDFVLDNLPSAKVTCGQIGTAHLLSLPTKDTLLRHPPPALYSDLRSEAVRPAITRYHTELLAARAAIAENSRRRVTAYLEGHPENAHALPPSVEYPFLDPLTSVAVSIQI